MFASVITSVVTVGDERVNVRKLSARTLGEARDARQAAQAKTLRNYGGDLLKAIRSESLDAAAQKIAEAKLDEAAARRARYDEFDRAVVLGAGITSWSCDRPLNSESISDLDQEASDKIFEAIVDLSIPTRGAEGKG
jgi:hypothetical protein